MKTIILVRHSEPIKDRTMPTEAIPLSEQGHSKAQTLFALDVFRPVKAVYSSPYRRAYSTAEKRNMPVTVDARFRERELGNPETGKTGTEKKEKAAWHPAILVHPEKVPRVSRK